MTLGTTPLKYLTMREIFSLVHTCNFKSITQSNISGFRLPKKRMVHYTLLNFLGLLFMVFSSMMSTVLTCMRKTKCSFSQVSFDIL